MISRTMIEWRASSRRTIRGVRADFLINQADLARLHGITRARVTQILNLLRLHPVIVNYLRARGYIGYGRAPTECLLRPLAAMSAEGQLGAGEPGGLQGAPRGRGRGVQGDHLERRVGVGQAVIITSGRLC